ncbi:hypothetical protein WJX81_006542 [Elliptochloris bilobata]|uniref:SAYSvFN domain-containing protein n=1 Tax=Elliptochloris bilobata TaxID=381761 RepID=A0AAW1R338_9CHLO
MKEDSVEELEELEGEEVKWGVMTVISFIPLFNWLAWVFAAFDDPQRARLYYLFAAVYAVPSLRNGFTLDSFSIACLLLGIVHVQVERVAQTEAVGLDLPAFHKARAPGSARSLTDASRAFKEAVGAGNEGARQGGSGAVPSGEKHAAAEAAAEAAREKEQLERWDARLRERERQAQREQEDA